MRKTVNPNWISKNGKHSLRIEIIEPCDLELIGNFINENFVKHGNLRKSIKITTDECKQLSFDTVFAAIQKPFSFVVFDGEKIVAVHLNRIYSPKEFPELFNGEFHQENPKLEIKDDYENDIQNGPYNLQANRIYVFVQDSLKQAGKFLPKTTKNVGYLKSTAVIPEYQNTGIAECLGHESIKLFNKHQCEYIMGFALVEISYRLASKFGLKKCFEFPYSKFEENSKPVFADLSENGLSAKFLIGKAEDLLQIILEAEKQIFNKTHLSKI